MHLLYNLTCFVQSLSVAEVIVEVGEVSLEIGINLTCELACHTSPDNFAVGVTISQNLDHIVNNELESTLCAHSHFIWKYLILGGLVVSLIVLSVVVAVSGVVMLLSSASVVVAVVVVSVSLTIVHQ